MKDVPKLTASRNAAPSADVPTEASHAAVTGPGLDKALPPAIQPARPAERPESRDEYAYVPAFVAMVVLAAAERWLVACLLTKAANNGSWLAVEAFVFLFDRQPTLISILLGFDIQEVNPIGSPLTFLRAMLQFVHFGLHFAIVFFLIRSCYRFSRPAGHAACVVGASLMLGVWFVLLPALGAPLPGSRKAEKEPPRKVRRPFD
jgi:hypothetical protein